jgi:hypothetical protein
VFEDSFENGLIDWSQDTQNDWFTPGQRSVDGNSSAQIDGNAFNAQLISPTIFLQETSDVTITYDWFIEYNWDTGEYIAFDISTDNGATWVEQARLRGNVDQENTWHTETINLSNVDNLKMRFRGRVSSTLEDGNVDMIVVSTIN